MLDEARLIHLTLIIEIFNHTPNSPNLTSTDFHVFTQLKEIMGGKHFRIDNELQTPVIYLWQLGTALGIQI